MPTGTRSGGHPTLVAGRNPQDGRRRYDRPQPTDRGRCRSNPEVTVPTSVPEVVFSDQRLANGLRVIVAEDHLAPVVAVNV